MYDIIVLLNLLRYQSAELRSHFTVRAQGVKTIDHLFTFLLFFANQTVL